MSIGLQFPRYRPANVCSKLHIVTDTGTGVTHGIHRALCGEDRLGSATTYLTDMRFRADYGPIREEFFGRKMPPHTLVAVAALALPEFLIEVEAIAVI
jgi:enamine deaminase RidA (YjgF/YER057c/UK114 family)